MRAGRVLHKEAEIAALLGLGSVGSRQVEFPRFMFNLKHTGL